MKGDSVTVLVFLLAALAAPYIVYSLYVSLRDETRPRMKLLKGALLGALSAGMLTAIVGAVVLGSHGGDVAEKALLGALVFTGFFGIPAAVAGAVIGVVVLLYIQRAR